MTERTQTEELIRALEAKIEHQARQLDEEREATAKAKKDGSHFRMIMTVLAHSTTYALERLEVLDAGLAERDAQLAETEEERRQLSNHCAVLEDQVEEAAASMAVKVTLELEKLPDPQREAVTQLLDAGWSVVPIVVLMRDKEEATVLRNGRVTVHGPGTL